jgi:hypothetical protein
MITFLLIVLGGEVGGCFDHAIWKVVPVLDTDELSVMFCIILIQFNL